MINPAHITSLLAFQVNVKLLHWQAPSTTNQHKALGDLHDAIADLVDDFAEIVLGKNGNRDLPKGESIALSLPAYVEILAGGLKLLAEIRADLKAGEDDDLLNILADMSAAINHAKYFLQL